MQEKEPWKSGIEEPKIGDLMKEAGVDVGWNLGLGTRAARLDWRHLHGVRDG